MDVVTITSCPVGAIMGQAAMIVGVRRQADDAVRIYLAYTRPGIYIVIEPGDAAEGVIELWNGHGGHLWLSPLPPEDALHLDPELDRC